MSPALDTLGRSLNHWQALYILAITLALLSTFAILVFSFHLKKRNTELRVSNYVYVLCSVIAVVATIVIVAKSHALDAEKDREVTLKQKDADLRIQQSKTIASQAEADAQIAKQRAEEARLKAADANKENSNLRIDVSREQKATLDAEAKLREENRETFNYAHALAQQQATMAEQAHVSPVLTDFQVDNLGRILAPYKGQDVILHSTLDTTVLRLKQTIAMALLKAGLTFKDNSMDAGALYKGVSVIVHSPQDVPALANSLVLGLRSSGVDVNTVSMDSIPQGRVAIYLGPN